MRIDLNCDMGESFGIYSMGADETMIHYITSVNIACGFHAGDPNSIARTVTLAKSHGVAIGAHPGYADLAGFGRHVISMSELEIENMMLYQLGALYAFAHAQGVVVRHIKPHGALYNASAADPKVARAIARAVTRFDSRLILVGLAASALMQAAHDFGLNGAREGFIDRAYKADGMLMPRHETGAVVSSPARAVQAAMQLVRDGTVRTVEGKLIQLEVDTLCIHTDTPHAVDMARAVQEALRAAGVEIKSLWES